MFDYNSTQADLETLHHAASAFEGWQKVQAKQFIKVGEYGPALDGIAYAYLANHTLMPANLFQLFEKLATTMDLDGDDEFQGVARLRRAQANAT